MKSRTLVLSLAVATLVCGVASAHLCNDVFVQATDNLAVKVDVRDGQLRVDKEASFRVYVLNTMDRDIAEIALRVQSEQFDADVKPGEDWKRYPVLQTSKRGGKKEHFVVTLRRKAGVADGAYKIGLDLYSKRQKRSFAQIDLGQAGAVCELPRPDALALDGNAPKEEWGESHVCTGFTTYEKAGRYFESKPVADDPRFRLMADDDALYALLYMRGGEGAVSDSATILAASSPDAEPVAITFDRVQGTVSCERGTEGVEFKVTPDRPMIECRIPRRLLGIDGIDVFHLNMMRVTKTADQPAVTSYWRGNDASVNDPIAYAAFRAAAVKEDEEDDG